MSFPQIRQAVILPRKMENMDIKRRFILAIVLLSYFVTAINGAIVITGLTEMAEELRLDQSALSWVQNAYVLAWGGFMLLGGRLSDTFGRRQMLNLSLVLFGIGSLLAGVATTAVVLVFSRFMQGVGAAVLAPTSLALIMDCFEGQERVKAIAWYSSISGLGMCIGLIIGGISASFFSWRYGFFIYLPLILFMLAISVKVLAKGEKEVRKIRFDIWGTIYSVLGIFSLVYAIDGSENAWLWIGVALCFLFLFVRQEKKVPEPIMPMRLFNGIRARANIARLLFAGAMMGFYFFISEFLQEVFHFTPLWIGIAFLPLTLSTFLGAMKVPKAVRLYGNNKTLFSGLTLMSIGFVCLLKLDAASGYWSGIAMPMSFLGFGQGLVMSPLTNLGISNVWPEDSGAASGVVNAAHQIGCSVGLSVMVTVSSDAVEMAEICHIAMLVGFGFTLIAFAVMFFDKYKSTRRIWNL